MNVLWRTVSEEGELINARQAKIEELVDLLRVVESRLHRHLWERIRELGLSPPQALILRHVALDPGQTVSELSRRLNLAKSHVSGLVEGLVRDGWLERVPDPADRRLQRLQTTPHARASWQGVRAAQLRHIDELVGPLPDHQLEQVLAALRLLAAACQPLPRGDGGCPTPRADSEEERR